MDVTAQIPYAIDSCRDRRFLEAFEAAAIGMGICHFDGRLLEANCALGGLLGYDRDELTGIDPWKLPGAEFPGLESGRDNGKDNDSQHFAELMRGERSSFAVDKRFRRKDGSEFWGHLTVSLARDANRNPAFLLVLLEDATASKRGEENLRQAEKMEVIGRLAGAIAHDFNNLLTGILLYCDLLLAEFEPEHPLRRHVEEVRMAGEQGAALTQQLLAMARKQGSAARPVSVNEVVSSTENLLRRLVGEQIEVVTVLDPAAGTVFADPAQLRQILLNLVLNARDAISPPEAGQNGATRGGTIRIGTRAREFPAHDGPCDLQLAVALIVEDNGCGMSMETRARLFEPFFTTKLEGQGTGLGLATVQRIAGELGGLIKIASEPGCGTRIEVLLPAQGPSARARLPEHPVLFALRGVPAENQNNVLRAASNEILTKDVTNEVPNTVPIEGLNKGESS